MNELFMQKYKMKKLDNKQKLIWDHSAQIDLPPLPNKEDIWLRLIQHMEISERETSKKRAGGGIVPFG